MLCGWEEPAEFVRHDRLDEFGGDRGDWDRMRFSILCLGPVDDPFLGVPLVNMEGSDFFDALASQRQNANSARVGWMDGRIRAFEPSIESGKLIPPQPGNADDLRLGRNSRRRVMH